MGGTSGVLVSYFLNGAADAYEAESTSDMVWKKAFVKGTAEVMEKGGARVGHRTSVDALKPAADALDARMTLSDALVAAREGCESTKKMARAMLGRSANVPPEQLLNNADPGAHAVCVILEALNATMK